MTSTMGIAWLGSMKSGVLQGLPRKAPEILVFAHLGIVDVPLASDPLCLLKLKWYRQTYASGVVSD